MISVPTCLILGAGASQPYGYPLGGDLLTGIAQGAFDLPANLKALGFEEGQIRDFQQSLAASGVGSVDAYLERVDRHREIGRIALAHQMLHHDNRAANLSTDWLGYVWRLLIEDVTKPEQLAGNRLSIVTFNYDTSVERAIQNAIQKTFDIPSRKAAEFAAAVYIVHVYGRLPIAQTEDQLEPIPATPENARGAADSLLVLHEGVDDSSELVVARQLLMQAQQRFFLGFAYLKENVTRLRVNTWLTGRGLAPWGTTHGMTTGEVERTQRLFPPGHQLQVLPKKCIDAIREKVHLLTT